MIFSAVLAYCAAVRAACGCLACCIGASELWHSGDIYEDGVDGGEVPSADFRIGGRWNTVATTGSDNNQRGLPQTVTWSVVDDGTGIFDSRGTDPSSFVSMMNNQYGSGSGGVESAPWFTLIEQSFARWSELSGLTFLYESNDGGAAIDGTTSPAGQTGVYADIRIGGHPLDGGGGTLAYAYFPNHGDIVFDTGDSGSYGNRSNNSRFFRNVLMHEIGHTLGFNHLESNNSGQLMEPSINTGFDGPQIDDILAVHRNYGDALEKREGNDNTGLATPLGDFAPGETASIGKDGVSLQVSPSQTDFVSIDGDTDQDYFSFTVSEPTLVTIQMIQVGPTYNEGAQGGEQSPLVANMLNDLNLALREPGGRSGVTIAEGVPFGRTPGEGITDFALTPGEYFVRVVGTENAVQLYSLDLFFGSMSIPEPSAIAFVLGAVFTGVLRRASP